jgi:hypothetical protein
MNWKILLPAFVTLARALSGCGGDDCSRADDQLAACMPAMSSSSSGGTMTMTPACAGAVLCRSQCINQFTCTQIMSNTPSYANCLALCQGK